jgi:serine/threonine protein kinase
MKWVKWDDSNFLGKGQFGSVYAGLRLPKLDGKPTWGEGKVAVKIMSPPEDFKAAQALMAEIEIMARVSHPALLSLFAWDIANVPEDGPQMYIMVTRCLKMGLDHVLAKPPPEWDATAKSLCLLGIACGLLSLHTMKPFPVFHRDLKPANVLLDDELKPVVCDFGLSKMVDPAQQLAVTMNVGTPLYMAPELLDGAPRTQAGYTGKIDVYAYSMIVYEIITGLVPFSDQKKKLTSIVLQGLILKRIRPKFPPDTPPNWVEFIESCWDHDPDNRPSFADIVARADELLKLEGCDEARWDAYKATVTAVLTKTK